MARSSSSARRSALARSSTPPSSPITVVMVPPRAEDVGVGITAMDDGAHPARQGDLTAAGWVVEPAIMMGAALVTMADSAQASLRAIAPAARMTEALAAEPWSQS